MPNEIDTRQIEQKRKKETFVNRTHAYNALNDGHETNLLVHREFSLYHLMICFIESTWLLSPEKTFYGVSTMSSL